LKANPTNLQGKRKQREGDGKAEKFSQQGNILRVPATFKFFTGDR
jgi:hypothetical protein